MKLVIGVDEAGYGPNLGPLVVAASIWSLADGTSKNSLPASLSDLCKAKSGNFPLDFLPLGDSKKIYNSGESKLSLEAGLVGLLSTTVERVPHNHELERRALQRLSQHCALSRSESRSRGFFLPWYSPSAPDSASMTVENAITPTPYFQSEVIEQVKRDFAKIGVRFVGLASDVVDETRFNALVEEHDNKSNVLSLVSLGLVRKIFEAILVQPINATESIQADQNTTVLNLSESFETDSFKIDEVEIICDRHGGRKRYQALLSHVFPDSWFHIQAESNEKSTYQADFFGVPTQWSFVCKGDSLAAPAAASMLAKWVREVFMMRLNSFWQEHIPELSPTAGYPVDAIRYAAAIATVANQMKLDRSQWWRNK